MKKNDIEVDVIIPTYNGMPWLEATVKSVLGQTHEKLTLYIVDDGSTDDTEKYVKSINDSRVVYIKKPNGGQSTARNLGIAKSSSPFVAFLDSDDIWYPEKLEKQLAVFKKNPKVGMVYGHHYLIDENDVIQGNLRHWYRGDIFNELCRGNFISGSASMVLVRREVFDKVGVFRESFLIGEDWEMWLRIAKEYEIDFVPEIIAALRQRSDSMQTNHKKMADGLVQNYFVIKEEFGLTSKQRAELASYSLFHAGAAYLAIGRRRDARRTFLTLFREAPGSVNNWYNWKLHATFGIFSKAILGNPVFDLWLRIYRKGMSLVKLLIKIILRLYRKFISRR